MTDLAPARSSTIVPANEWILMNRQAEMLAQSDIIPKDYRRKPANIIAAALSGRAHGWDVMASMRNGHVIEGTWGVKPEAQLGLVRKAGHSVTGTMTAEGATVLGRRGDDGTEMEITFTIEDAKRAGLAGKQTWRNYPQMMCWWRAIGILCRVHFSDVTLGLMSVEELGADINEEGDVIDVGPIDHGPREPAPLSESVMEQFGKACDTEGLTTAEVLGAAFPDGMPDPLTDEHLPHMRDVFKTLVAERAGVVEAEIVEDQAVRRDEIEGGTEGAGESVRPAGRGKVGLIKAAYERMGYDRDMQLETTSAVLGRDITTHNELNDDEASRMLDYLNGLEEP